MFIAQSDGGLNRASRAFIFMLSEFRKRDTITVRHLHDFMPSTRESVAARPWLDITLGNRVAAMKADSSVKRTGDRQLIARPVHYLI
jgi:hypothetical protein